MGDLLYYYCGGDRAAVIELLVSLYSLVASNPKRTFQVGIALDSESRQWVDVERVEGIGNCSVRVFEDEGVRYCGRHVHHIVNRWRATELFDFERILILDTDTIVHRPLDTLFDEFPADREYFTTFAGYSERDRDWQKHCRYYDAVCSDYDRRPLYCAIGMHGFRKGWPYLGELVSTLIAMDAVQGRRRGSRAFLIDEFAVNLTLLRNNRKVWFPGEALVKASRAANTSPEALPYVSHFMLGRARRFPVWRQTLAELADADFLNSAELVNAVSTSGTDT